MMSWIKRKKIVVRPEKLQRISDILFPPLESRGSGKEKYQIDYSVDTNLESALSDLRDGLNDTNVQNTIAKTIDALTEVRKILKAFPEIDLEAQYIFVYTPDMRKGESIEAAE
jgi:hypothetical protein